MHYNEHTIAIWDIKVGKYRARWLNPDNKSEVLLERIIDQEELDPRGSTYHAVKKRFYTELSSLVPEIKEFGLTGVADSISVSRLDKRIPKREGVRKSIGGKLASLKAWQGTSEVSLDRGIIPKICPICKNPPFTLDNKFLVLHHWGTSSKLDCLRQGKYRRMCSGCNVRLGRMDLGWIYSDDATWEGQYQFLSKRLGEDKKGYPNFDGIEGEWSRFLPEENAIYEELILGLKDADG